MPIKTDYLNYTFDTNLLIPKVSSVSTLDDNNYSSNIHEKSGVTYTGASESFDIHDLPIYSDPQGKVLVGTYNWSHAQPQNGGLDSDGYYYTWIGAGSSSGAKNGFVNIAGVTMPFNNNFNRLIKWHTNIGGDFEYIGQAIFIGFAHANFSIRNNSFYIAGVNKYVVDKTNTLDGYQDIRVFKLPLDYVQFSQYMTDEDVYVVPAIGKAYGNDFKGVVVNESYMFERSPDFDEQGKPSNSESNHYQWMYLPSTNDRIYTSNGQNIMMYQVDNEKLKYVAKLPEQSLSLGLNNGGMKYSDDKNRITNHPTSDRSMSELNAWYSYTGGRYLQNIAVVGSHAYFLYGGSTLAHTNSNRYMLKILDLNSGTLLGEFDLENYISDYNLPEGWHIAIANDSEGTPYHYLTDDDKTYFQETEDLYVTDDESMVIVCYILDTPRYIKLNLQWGKLS